VAYHSGMALPSMPFPLMASIDKASVHEEIDHLKTQFEQLIAEGNLSNKATMLFNNLLLIVDLILAIFLRNCSPGIGVSPASAI